MIFYFLELTTKRLGFVLKPKRDRKEQNEESLHIKASSKAKQSIPKPLPTKTPLAFSTMPYCSVCSGSGVVEVPHVPSVYGNYMNQNYSSSGMACGASRRGDKQRSIIRSIVGVCVIKIVPTAFPAGHFDSALHAQHYPALCADKVLLSNVALFAYSN